MYQPPAFQTDDIPSMHQLMREHPFAALVSSSDDGLSADHLPLVLKTEQGEYGTLHGHIARANALWKRLEVDTDVLVIFQGPEHYITPSWYPSKKEHGKVVPTWNYMIVHATGPIRFTQDRDWLHAHLRDLTDQNEHARPAPWAVTDAPDDFMARQLRGIVGIEIPIARLEGKFKLSQNRAEQDYTGVVRGLDLEGTHDAQAMSQIMRRNGSA